jgi:hypothetical protein
LTLGETDLEQNKNIFCGVQELGMLRSVEDVIELASLAGFFVMVAIAYGAVGNLPLV